MLNTLNAGQTAAYNSFVKYIEDFDNAEGKAYRVLSGLGGTGKTYTAKAMADAYEGEVIFLSPTHRACKILSNAVGHEAKTLHSLLYIPTKSLRTYAQVSVCSKTFKLRTGKTVIDEKGGKHFECKRFQAAPNVGAAAVGKRLAPSTELRKLEEAEKWVRQNGLTDAVIIVNPTVEDVDFVPRDMNSLKEATKDCLLVVDEFSMVKQQTQLMLLKIGRPLLIMGDKNQLPPVYGEDEVKPAFHLSDNVDWHLTESMRSDSTSGVQELCADFLGSGGFNQKKYGQESKVSVFRNKGAQSRERNTRSAIKFMNHNYEDQDFQYLAFTRAVRDLVNKVVREDKGYSENVPTIYEKMVVTARKIELGLCKNEMLQLITQPDEHTNRNGSISGFVGVFLTESGEHIEMAFSLPNCRSSKKFRDEYPDCVKMDYGYCITVHCAQGSEFDNVAYIDQSFPSMDNQKELIYTACSRAKKKLVVFSNQTLVKGVK